MTDTFHSSRGLAQIIPPTFLQHRSITIVTSLFHTPYARAILLGLQRKHIYEGTVPEAEVARRRARNRAARKARRANRNN
ncbi:hypothetical protein SAMN05421776_12159 [Nocardia farcinica]|uniref:Uncharacterized protein n=1 Tax=Nocardia farcinica TaxID=37329 RepID=A0A0H5P9V0_NOCFR|nr:hypothetical protein [Nocardia farcinica]AXK88544.1 hypothetical protein DXT66_25630 [Nocardia farcinica]PFW98845.1 hypothetical protein CJ469_05806 [Nocardia farcinica]PFX04451.1 hypothetical protein CJ468_05427 [Nocardia farcinica]CRY84208.1 Uncharacterised protein [Nocardia farcinica]SIT34119.1 hypothetical protein SAMN05421776_12159 [Nocardia farcinica]